MSGLADKIDELMDEFDDDDTLGEYIKSIYYTIVPYEYRPHRLWYKLKCFVWYRYTTIKPRQLDHTWCDKAELVPYMMFEMLSEFLEKECSPCYVDWEGTDHRIQYGGHSRNVSDVMWHLYHWWHDMYLKKRNHEHDAWHKYFSDNTLNDSVFNPEWKSIDDSIHSDKLFNKATKKEIAMLKELNENLKVVVDLIPYLWT